MPVAVMDTPFSAACDLMDSLPDFIVQPCPQSAVLVGVTVTLLFRLMASLLARLRLENNSKLAFFICWLWVSDWKLGTAMAAKMPSTTTTTMSSVMVKPDSDWRKLFMVFLPLVGGCFGAVVGQGQRAITCLLGTGRSG